MIPLLSSIAPLGGDYDAWFCDIWGVMHNGQRAFSKAVDACRKFRSEGGRVILLTNAPRPAFSVTEQLEMFGVPRDCYDGIVSSGDVTLHLIAEHKEQPMHHIGPARDLPIIEKSGIRPVGLKSAEIILLTGLVDDDQEVPEDYRDRFEDPISRDLLMICANPDLKVERGERLIYCAGSVAQLYEEMGGRVSYAGKPYLPIYQLAETMFATLQDAAVDRKRILCIGDGLKTDMPGAFGADLDALFIASHLHVEGGELTDEGLQTLFQDFSSRPIAALSSLAW